MSIILIIAICLSIYGCGKVQQNRSIGRESATENVKKSEEEQNEEAGGKEDFEESDYEKQELTLEEARKIILNMDNSMQELTEQLDRQSNNDLTKEDIAECIEKYYDKNLTEYAMFLYRIVEENGKYIHDKYYARSNFTIDTAGEMEILSQGKNFCELGVTFTHKWEKQWDKEIVPVRLERENDVWIITEISQWYNDFRYNYMPDELFTPQYFTEEQAEDLVERFGTDQQGNQIRLSVRIDENGYIFADSSEKILSEDELKGYSKYELFLAIQEIYARHGKKFSDAALEQHFNRQSWYAPYEKIFSREILSDIEKNNIKLLAEEGRITQEADSDYGSLYPIEDKQEDILTGEEAVVIILNAFNAASEVIAPKEENYIEEKSQDVFQFYTLGVYSDKEKLNNYLSSWFSEEAVNYIMIIYEMCSGLCEDENGNYQFVTEGTYFGNWQEIDLSEMTEIIYADEKECRVLVPFVNYMVAWELSAELSYGEFLLKNSGENWIIAEISQTYYDELYQEYIKLYAGADT